MEENFQDLQKLLRLKRYEHPGPDYFEQFLEEFRQRQRTELLKRPLWQIALDRSRAWLDEFSFARVSYALAGSAALVFAAFVALNSGREQSIPKAPGSPIAKATPVSTHPLLGAREPRPVMQANTTLTDKSLKSLFDAASIQRASDRHYVLDARPVSYTPPFRF